MTYKEKLLEYFETHDEVEYKLGVEEYTKKKEEIFMYKSMFGCPDEYPVLGTRDICSRHNDCESCWNSECEVQE